MIILDTSILIDHLRGDPAARTAMTRAVDEGERLACSVLTKVEILAGMHPSEERATRRLLDALEWIPVDDAIADSAGALANRYLPAFPGVDPVDYVIAATAESSRATLWTLNRKHFPMFPDLALPY